MRVKLVVLVALLVATLGLAGCFDTPGGYGGYDYPSYGYGYSPAYGYGSSPAFGYRYGGWGRYQHRDHDWDHDGSGHWDGPRAPGGHPYGFGAGGFHNGGSSIAHAGGFPGGFGGRGGFHGGSHH
jgi:hypothetical protein